jgi:hypothetical protein
MPVTVGELAFSLWGRHRLHFVHPLRVSECQKDVSFSAKIFVLRLARVNQILSRFRYHGRERTSKL